MQNGFDTRARSLKTLRFGSAFASFFILKFGFGIALISLSSALLDVSEFVVFSQVFLFFALLSSIAAAGIQNGLAREIAVAHSDSAIEQKTIAAALRIWAVVSLILWLIIWSLRDSISTLLIGNESLVEAIPMIALAGLGGGLGVLACAVLNGRQRAPVSLMFQSIGLLVGGLFCIWSLNRGDAVGAVFGYSVGPLVTAVLGGISLGRMGYSIVSPSKVELKEIRQLLGYSVAFLAIAVVMPATLFALRFVYRESFGTDALAYWLAANRVSDVTSQILGLYMAQIFLPQIAREEEPDRVRRLIASTLLLCSIVMFGGWAIFLLGAEFFVTTFFSASYLAAIPFIGGYLLGDALRVTASLALHFMLARGRLAAAVSIEWGTAFLLTVYIVALSGLGYAQAPYWAYPVAHATMGMLVAISVWRSWLTKSARS
jgi:O-antigen/teichoic acid export membrane protein